MQMAMYLGLLAHGEEELARAFLHVARQHRNQYEIRTTATLLAEWSQAHVKALQPWIEQYGSAGRGNARQIRKALFGRTRMGGIGLLRDLNDLMALVAYLRAGWTALKQGAQELRNEELTECIRSCMAETDRQHAWIETQIKHVAPQALVVTPNLLRTIKSSLRRPRLKEAQPRRPAPRTMPGHAVIKD